VKRILILGGEGMLGHKMFQELSSRFETYVTFKDFKSPALHYPVYKDIKGSYLIEGIDSMNMGTVISAFAQVKPDIVINCIGIVKQLREAKNALISISINSLFPHQLADLCGAA
jgi:dTDP-4-dehydrorhamnose reductase